MRKLWMNVKWSVEEIWNFRKGYILSLFLSTFLSSAFPVFSALLTQQLFNMLQNSSASFYKCISLCLLLTGFETLCVFAIRNISTKIQMNEIMFCTHMQRKFLSRARCLDCREFEKNTTFDLINKIKSDMQVGIIGNLEAMIAFFSTILVLHRFQSVVRDADQIIILSNGHVEAAGTHETLLESDPFYRNFSMAGSRHVAQENLNQMKSFWESRFG